MINSEHHQQSYAKPILVTSAHDSLKQHYAAPPPSRNSALPPVVRHEALPK